jgi:hypothetical protein
VGFLRQGLSAISYQLSVATGWRILAVVLLIAGRLVADAGDAKFLDKRLTELSSAYDAQASRNTAAAAAVRIRIARELGHLPFRGPARERAGHLIARMLAKEASFRGRAAMAHTAVRIGTARSMASLYAVLFGAEGQEQRYELLYTVLPDALEPLKSPSGVDWLRRQVLAPAAAGTSSAALRQAGPLRSACVAFTLEGVGRAKTKLLAPEVAAIARDAKDRQVRVAAVRALARLEAGTALLEQAAVDADPAVRAAAAGYGRLPTALLRRAISDADPGVRYAVLPTLASRDPATSVPLLIGRLGGEQEVPLKLRMATLLNSITSKEFGTDASLWRLWWEANKASFAPGAERERGGERYFFDVPLRTRRALFVLDLSNSMSRTGMDGRTRQQWAAAELARTLSSLPPKSIFAVMAFSGSVRRWPDKPGSSSRATRATVAREWYEGQKPAGATNTYAALMEALADPLKPDTIVLLSDGNPYKCTWKGRNYSQHEQILFEVARANRRRFVRINTVALLTGSKRNDREEDSTAAAEFLRRLAAANDGEFREIR